MKNRFRNIFISLTLAVGLLGARPAPADTIDVTSNITGTETWYRTNEYVLTAFIYVLSNAVLNIEAGTVIKGQPGTDADTKCLVVCQGGKIFAQGTPDQPIIFTAEADDVTLPDDLPLFQRGLWGGVLILGRATLNTSLDPTGNGQSPKYDVFEGLNDIELNGQRIHRYGGGDDNDSSGVLRYVSIRHAGVVFAPNKELNGLTLGAVGRGTVIDHVEAYATADDGYEWFGGAVNTKYLVSAFNDDDGFDTDQGYHGKNQFWFAIQEPGRKDSGAELNGEPNGAAVSNAPIARFEVYNATWIGAGTNSGGNNGLTIREYAAPRIYNSILTEFGGNGVRITDDRSGAFLNNGTLDLRDNLWWNFALPVAGALADVLFTDTARNNVEADPMLYGISRAADGGLDPRPMAGSPALSSARTAPSDGFYTPVAYKGAFADINWATDWSALGSLGVLTGRGAGVPAVLPPTCSAVELVIVRSGSDVTISWLSQNGFSYQVQSLQSLPSDPGAAQWNDEGGLQQGNGSTLSYTASSAGSARFFRVLCR